MSANFYTDNPDLMNHLTRMDIAEAVGILEDGYAYAAQYADAPRSYRDAVDSYGRMLELLGDICANHIAPRAAEAASEGASFSEGTVCYSQATQDALELLRQADLMGAMLPREYGGLNLPETVYGMMIELVSRAEAGLMTVFGLQEISATVAEYGDDDLKSRILPRFARGEVTGAMVLTEPDAGSDLGVVQTRATYDESNDEWRLSGVKRFITNGCADVLLVLARSEEGSSDARGLSMFAVEADDSMRIRRIENKMGLHASPTCEVEFSETPAVLLGRRRFGLIRYAMSMMNGARLAVASQALGIAEAAYREALAYSRKRVQFSHPICEIPAVYRMLLEMQAEIAATRALVYETGRWVDLKKAYERKKDEGEITPEGRKRLRQADRLAGVLTPLAKYHATEMGNRLCYDAMQVHGGAGYMREFNVERHSRDMRVTSIYEGTSQLQVVAATGGLLGEALDDLLEGLAEEETAAELAEVREAADEATQLLHASIARLKDQEREVTDYYAVDLTELAAHTVNCWLILRNAGEDPQRRELARVYAATSLPKIKGWAAALDALDPAPFRAREVLLPGDD